jgi:hypothetical protein
MYNIKKNSGATSFGFAMMICIKIMHHMKLLKSMDRSKGGVCVRPRIYHDDVYLKKATILPYLKMGMLPEKKSQ